MTTTINADRGVSRDLLPDDLSHYLGKKTLVKLILEAVQVVNGESVRYEGFASDGMSLPKSMMLTLVAYCYATGVYPAGEIEQNVQRDQMTRYLCAKTYPNGDAIRAFRRYHRAEIRQCLAVLFRRAWALRFSGDDEGSAGDESYSTLSMARWIDSRAQPDFDLEAEARLARAVRVDSMALDV